MRKYRTVFNCFLATLLVALVAGCGQETVTIPGVVSVTPAQGATGVAVTTTVTATFNMAMSPASITTGTFTLAGPGGAAVTGAVTYSGLVAKFTPAASLANGTTYTATITTGAATPGGAELVSDYVWTFTTAAAIIPPVPPVPFVVSVTPLPFADPVALAAPITATFSQPMSCASLQTAFTVTAPGDVPVTGVVTCVLNESGDTVATFTPTGGALPSYGTTYTATISTGATDTPAGTALASNYVWTFTTLTPPPVITAAPTVQSTLPVNGATSVPTNLQIISAAFSEPMDPNTIVRANFTLTYLVGSVITPVTGGTVAYAAIGNELVFVLPANLLPSTTYTATITNGVQDVAFTALNGGPACDPTLSTGGNCVWTFMTGTTTVTTPPELVSTVPANSGTADVCPLQAVSATFNEAMNPLSLSTSSTSSTTFLVSPGTATPTSATALAGKYSYDPTSFIATFTPTNPLTLGTSYTAEVTNGATNVAGIPLGTTGPPNPWTFKTVTTDTPSCQPPVVLGPTILPFGGFSGTAGMTNTGLTTVIHGDSGTTATAATSYTGFHDNTVLPVIAASTSGCTYTETTANVGLVTGTIYSPIVPNGSCPEGTAADIAIADEALAEATTAYTTLAGLPSSGALAGQIGLTTIYPGVWTTSGPVLITAGDVTLDAKGDPNARFVFQIGTILTVGLPATPCNVILTGGAKASNIFWVVEGTGVYLEPSGGGTFEGTIIATNFIHVSTAGYVNPVTVNGRLISLNASTTLVDTVINVPPAP